MHLVDRDRRVERIDAGAAPVAGRDRRRSSTTIEAVCGRISAAKATGSDFSGSSAPSAPTISYL